MFLCKLVLTCCRHYEYVYIHSPKKVKDIIFLGGYFLLFEICHYNIIKKYPQKK